MNVNCISGRYQYYTNKLILTRAGRPVQWNAKKEWNSTGIGNQIAYLKAKL